MTSAYYIYFWMSNAMFINCNRIYSNLDELILLQNSLLYQMTSLIVGDFLTKFVNGLQVIP